MTLYTTPPFIHKTRITAWEQSPFVFDGDLYRAGFSRAWSLYDASVLGIIIEKYDATLECFHRVGFIPWNRLLGSILSVDGQIYATGSSDVSQVGNAVYIREIDPTTWTFAAPEVHVSTAPAGQKYYNTSITKGPDKYVMAIETDEGTPFSIRFVQSTDLVTWSPIGALCHGNFYSACPTLRYVENGWYMLVYMFIDAGEFVNGVARTQDFTNLVSFGGNANYTPYQQIMAPDVCEGINNSDIDFIEWDGKVYFTYLTGDQQTWAFANDAWYDGTLSQLYHEYWV